MLFSIKGYPKYKTETDLLIKELSFYPSSVVFTLACINTSLLVEINISLCNCMFYCVIILSLSSKYYAMSLLNTIHPLVLRLQPLLVQVVLVANSLISMHFDIIIL